jgi:Kdo2-lipid IVA lauroyltransferase/acyltransferase
VVVDVDETGRTMKRGKRAKRWIVFQLARVVLGSIAILPEPLALVIGRAIGAIAFLFARSPRKRAIDQLSTALGDASSATDHVRALFRHLGLMIAELALLSRRSDRVVRWVEMRPEHKELLDRILARGRGMIAVSAHLGNWELLPQRFTREGYKVLGAARENPNPYLDRWIVELRDRGGVRTVHRGGDRGGLEILRALRRGEIFAALVDQDTRTPSVFVPFFGRPASTPIGPARLALTARAPMVISFIVREGDRHQVTIEEVPLDDLPEDFEAAAIALTERITQRIEEEIRTHPDQWVWFHERWRRQPVIDAEPVAHAR